MDSQRNYIIKLTAAVYKVTDRLPQNEPLRVQIRQKANEILSIIVTNNPHLTSASKENLATQLKALSAYFDLAQTQNWVDARNFLILKQAYYKFIETILSKLTGARTRGKGLAKSKPKKSQSHLKPEERQKMIIDVLEKKKEISLAEVRRILPGVGARTLRRDLKVLASREDIQKIRAGRKEVIYRLLPQTDHKQLFAG